MGLEHRKNLMIVNGDREEIFDVVRELEKSDELYNTISSEGKRLAISLLQIEIQKEYVSNLMYVSKLIGNINAQREESPNSFTVAEVKGYRRTNTHPDLSLTRAYFNTKGSRSTLITTIMIMCDENDGIINKTRLMEKARCIFTDIFTNILLPGISNTLDRTAFGRKMFEVIFTNVECEQYHSLENGDKVFKSTCHIESIINLFKTFNRSNRVSNTNIVEIMINLKNSMDYHHHVTDAFILFSNTTGREKMCKDVYARVSISVTGEMMFTGLHGKQVFVKCNKELLWLEKNDKFSCISTNELDSVDMIRRSKVNSPFYVRIG